MRWTIPYSSFRGESLHESILTPQSADRRLEQKNSVTAEKGFASNPNDFSSSLKIFLVRTWSRDQLTPEHKVTRPEHRVDYEPTKRRMPLSSCSSSSLMTGRGDRSLKCLFPLEAFWHFIFLDFRNGKFSDLSFEFEFLFYRRTVTKRRASARVVCIAKICPFLTLRSIPTFPEDYIKLWLKDATYIKDSR